MRKKQIITGYLTRKLVLAFILVAVPPMLIAGKVATELVNTAINNNVEHWLRTTTRYIMASIQESESELRAVHTLLQARFAGKEVAFSPEELDAFSVMDADIILLRDAAGKVLLSSPPVREIAPTLLFPDSHLKWVTLGDGSQELAIVVGSDVPAWDGSRRTLELANLFVIELSESGMDEPVSLRVFLPTGDGFIQAYPSVAKGLPDVPKEALHAVLSGSGEVFVPDRDWTDNTSSAHLFLKGIFGKHGETVAILAVSAHMLPYYGWLPSSRQLFWGIFVAGMLLASSVGYFLARRIVHPIQLLNEGVKDIASGNLEHRIAVRGGDEIAELSAGFNLMGMQLEAMRREGMESARRDRSRMLGEIALGFAHEIRNPLVVIKTSAELVHTKLPEGSKDSRLMGFVVEEVGRIDSLVREFLAFATPAPVAFGLFSLHKLARDVLEISAAEFGKRNVRHSLAAEAADCTVLGEKNQIRQVLLNLLLNAMDAMPDGGELRLHLYEPEDKRRICMDVADTGTGIPDDLLPTIYQPFSSTKKGGLGLGLAKAQVIIEAHGGSIACCSEPGRGTVFTICLNKGSG
jgi:Signal transduction histidine kinase, nitrogen specific